MEARIKNEGNKSPTSTEKQLEVLHDLKTFELGRFLLQNRGLNGYWTQYMVTYPEWKSSKQKIHILEEAILGSLPSVLATQERFRCFKNVLQNELKEEIRMASVPCGLMADFLHLNYSDLNRFTLIGVDLDRESLKMAKEIGTKRGLEGHIEFHCLDARKLNLEKKVDVIASNGLNIYLPNLEEEMDLYQVLWQNLKEGGLLVTSFLSRPPTADGDSEWKMDLIDQKSLILQKIIFADILQAKWQNYNSSTEIKAKLQKTGFYSVQIIYDKAHIFPTVAARK